MRLRPICGRRFEVSGVIMMPSHDIGVQGQELCSDRRSTRDCSRRAAPRYLAGSSPRLICSTAHRTIACGVSCHSPRRISYAVSQFSFLRLASCREQATKKTPDEELAEKVHWGTSSFGRSEYPVAPRKAAVNAARLVQTDCQSNIVAEGADCPRTAPWPTMSPTDVKPTAAPA